MIKTSCTDKRHSRKLALMKCTYSWSEIMNRDHHVSGMSLSVNTIFYAMRRLQRSHGWQASDTYLITDALTKSNAKNFPTSIASWQMKWRDMCTGNLNPLRELDSQKEFWCTQLSMITMLRQLHSCIWCEWIQRLENPIRVFAAFINSYVYDKTCSSRADGNTNS